MEPETVTTQPLRMGGMGQERTHTLVPIPPTSEGIDAMDRMNLVRLRETAKQHEERLLRIEEKLGLVSQERQEPGMPEDAPGMSVETVDETVVSEQAEGIDADATVESSDEIVSEGGSPQEDGPPSEEEEPGVEEPALEASEKKGWTPPSLD